MCFYSFIVCIFLGYFIFLEADSIEGLSISLRVQLDAVCRYTVQFDFFMFGSHVHAIIGEAMTQVSRERKTLFVILRDGGKKYLKTLSLM